MVDRETVLTRLARMHEMLDILRELQTIPVARFCSDRDLYLKAERCLEVLAQAALDIGSHLIAERGLSKPDRYSDVFRILGQNGVLEQTLADRLTRLAGLRNILVHEYLAVDRERLHEFIVTDLVDLELFIAAVSRLAG